MASEFAKIAGVIGLLGYIPYMLAIFKIKTIPNLATWWIWGVIGWVAFASYFSAGGHETFWLMLSYAIGPSIIALMSLKYGRGDVTRFDVCCLIISGVSLILWVATSRPLLVLTINLGIDIIGCLPTVRKTYFEPHTEDSLAWIVFWVGNTFNFVAVLMSRKLDFATLSYPVYLFLLASIMVALIIKKPHKKIDSQTDSI